MRANAIISVGLISMFGSSTRMGGYQTPKMWGFVVGVDDASGGLGSSFYYEAPHSLLRLAGSDLYNRIESVYNDHCGVRGSPVDYCGFTGQGST